MKISRIVAAVMAFAVPVFASAAPVAAIVVTDVTTGLDNQITPMTAIFTASLGLAVCAAAFHWVRRALGK